jgi:biotin/methionine sulfoxide reductase
MDLAMDTKQHACHWGAFTVGPELKITPAEDDPAPSRLLRSIPANLDTELRVLAPYARRGWLENGPGPDTARGTDDYVRLTWAEAERLAADELDRCRRAYGNGTIYGSSYGWAGGFITPRVRFIDS